MKELFVKNKISTILFIICIVEMVIFLIRGDSQRVINFIFVGYMILANIRDNQIMERICRIESDLELVTEQSLRQSKLLYKAVKDIYK